MSMHNIIDFFTAPLRKEGNVDQPGSTKGDSADYADMPLQFIVGIVTSAITNPIADGFAQERDMNSVLAITNTDFKRAGSRDFTHLQDKSRLYQPLLRGIQDVPTQGDPVLLCLFEGVSYYLGPLNTFGHPNFNPDIGLPRPSAGSSTLRSQLMVNPELDWNPDYKRLQKPVLHELDEDGGLTTPGETVDDKIRHLGQHGVGDLTLEGRFGNSIRVGSRGNSPCITISNGRRMNNTTEMLSDANTIFLGKKGRISSHYRLPLELYSNLVALENNRPLVFEDRDRRQMYFDSDTVIFNVKGDGGTEENELNEGFVLSSYSNIRFGAGNNFELSTNNSTVIDSRNIYLGRGAMEDHIDGNPVEPMVLGEELRLLLLEVVEIMEMFKVTGCIAGMSGPPAPDVLSKLMKVKNTLNREKEAGFQSQYHFIETNTTEK